MTKNTGGAAFPQSVRHLNGHIAPLADGMTLRDYFAAKAMQSLILAAKNSQDVDMLATGAYQMADAMIEERNK